LARSQAGADIVSRVMRSCRVASCTAHHLTAVGCDLQQRQRSRFPYPCHEGMRERRYSALDRESQHHAPIVLPSGRDTPWS
jgi:hypothetical protein